MKYIPFNLEEYQCKSCGRLFYIKLMKDHSHDKRFACPYGCYDIGQYIQTVRKLKYASVDRRGAFDHNGQCSKCGSKVAYGDAIVAVVSVGDKIIKDYGGIITNRHCLRCDHPKEYLKFKNLDDETDSSSETKKTDKRYITYRGARVREGWPEEIRAAQKQTTYVINGKVYWRIRYGDEARDWGADEQPCGDCKVIKGEFHVIGCDIEQCPACGGQSLSCDCKYEGDDEE